jgi:hypothetical protein
MDTVEPKFSFNILLQWTSDEAFDCPEEGGKTVIDSVCSSCDDRQEADSVSMVANPNRPPSSRRFERGEIDVGQSPGLQHPT